MTPYNLEQSFKRDMYRRKYRNCVLMLFQYRNILNDNHFVKLFYLLVEGTPCIDFIKLWDLNSQYKYYQLLDEYILLCA